MLTNFSNIFQDSGCRFGDAPYSQLFRQGGGNSGDLLGRDRSADFVEQIDNPYYPLTPGTTFIYEGKRTKASSEGDRRHPRYESGHGGDLHGDPGPGLFGRGTD
jgi:hypothetical protein